MRILLIAPSQASLPLSAQEVEAVVNSGLSVKLLQSNVSQRDLVSELSVPGRYDIIWFATHGDSNGVFLTNEVLSPSAVISLIRGSGAKLVFLNTCSSVSTASAIQNEASVDVICTITDVPDVDAYRTGAQFAAKLFQTGEFRKSYELSKPGRNSTYIYLSAAVPTQNGKSDYEQLRKTVDELESAARSRDKATVHSKVDELNAIGIRIDKQDGELKVIKGDIHDVKQRVTTLEDHVFIPRKVWIWRVLSLITVFVAIAVLAIEDLSKIFLSGLLPGVFFEAAILSLAMIFWYVGFLTAKQSQEDSNE